MHDEGGEVLIIGTEHVKDDIYLPNVPQYVRPFRDPDGREIPNINISEEFNYDMKQPLQNGNRIV